MDRSILCRMIDGLKGMHQTLNSAFTTMERVHQAAGWLTIGDVISAVPDALRLDIDVSEEQRAVPIADFIQRYRNIMNLIEMMDTKDASDDFLATLASEVASEMEAINRVEPLLRLLAKRMEHR